MRLLVKICGVTTPEDARDVAAAGADAIGVNFWSGSRRFAGARATEILAAIPAGVLKVGVFVNPDPAAVDEALERHQLDRVQLHGDERAADFARLPRDRTIRAVRVKNAASLQDLDAWSGALYLYDADVPGYGGGGVKAPWEVLSLGAPRPFLLAGGLTPDNVASAIHAVRPDGVDVASGVEASPGRKDLARVRDFIARARQAAAALP
jgi:phosphoribosylanthranilate isomerase